MKLKWPQKNTQNQGRILEGGGNFFPLYTLSLNLSLHRRPVNLNCDVHIWFDIWFWSVRFGFRLTGEGSLVDRAERIRRQVSQLEESTRWLNGIFFLGGGVICTAVFYELPIKHPFASFICIVDLLTVRYCLLCPHVSVIITKHLLLTLDYFSLLTIDNQLLTFSTVLWHKQMNIDFCWESWARFQL